MITTLAVENYRSLRRLVVPLRRVNVVAGANGAGKSSVYRSLRVLADSARNGAVAALAREGGLRSTLWAGPENAARSDGAGTHTPVGLRLGFAGDEFGYAIDFGLPNITHSMFTRDPEIKAEATWAGPVLRPATLLAERAGNAVRIRAADGGWHRVPHRLRPYDSMLSELADPQNAAEVMALREYIRSWRFYDHVRADAGASARTGRIGTRTPVLSQDGSDLAAALQTIREIGDDAAMDAAVDRAFPGSRVEITEHGGRFELALRQPGLLRPLNCAELSDGTLRYLLWTAALLTPRPPALLTLNEPETSLHPELLRPLAELVVTAAEHTQIIVVTHSRQLASGLEKGLADTPDGLQTIELVKENGATAVAGQGLLDEPPWHWPKR
ncbi:AAA family ATPase [Actinomadura sp. LOL_016]|uniref:AAA family ATPase n=1 Tax=unclassified Actinomadura TaxID=2626254 RepID=UPI003A808502